MNNQAGAFSIVVADDDPDDRLLIKDAFDEISFDSLLRFVDDGEKLISYLFREKGHSDSYDQPVPDLIILDINMPRFDGWEVLKLIKEHFRFRKIPTMILSTTNNQDDIDRAYELGANAFVTKPATFDELKNILEATTKFWLKTINLPSKLD
jgi:CheY-like chemotaxis protein